MATYSSEQQPATMYTHRKASPWGYFFYCELLKIFRNPATVFFSIGFPTMFFLIFGFSLDARFASTILASYAAYGAFIVAFQTIGISLATERSLGWNKLLRTTSMSSTLYLGSKVLVILLTGVISMLLLFAVAAISGKVHLALIVWAQLLGMMIIGMVPLSLLGLFIGFIGSPNLTTALSTILTLLLSFASGLFLPLSFMPDFIQKIAPFLPSYHLGQIAWIIVDSPNGDGQLWTHLLILLAYGAGFAVLAAWAYIRDENKNFA